MKKLFEKHDLFKLAGLFVLIAILLSWFIPYAFYDNGVAYGINNEAFKWSASLDYKHVVGLFDWSSYSLLGFWYFTALFMFVIVVAGLYKFLNSTAAYQSLTDKVANIFKGKEKVLVIVSTLLFAMFAGVATDPFITLILIPFVITIFSKLKVDKLSALSSTFGGVLVGMFGATYSTNIVGSLVDSNYGLGSANVQFGFERAAVIVLFVVAYLLITYFAISRLSKKDTPVVDLFAEEEVKTTKKTKKAKISIAPMAIFLGLLFLVAILAYIPWSGSFGVSFFNDLYNDIIEYDGFFKTTIFASILGDSFKAFGELDLLGICGYIFVFILIIKIIYHIPFDNIIDSFGEGIKRFGKSLVLLIIIYAVLEFSILFPTIPAVVSAILGLGNNLITLFVSGLYTNLFTVDFQYTVTMVGSAFAQFKDANVAALILQATNGIIKFFAPTSAILMVGLSMLDIKYKDYFKYIWKFLLAITVVTLIVLAILIYA